MKGNGLCCVLWIFFRVPLFYCLFEYVLLFVWVPKTPYTVYLWPHLIFIIKGKVRNRDTLINKKIITVFSEASLLFSFLYCKQWDLIFVGKEKKQEKTCIVRAKQVDKILRHTLKCVLCHFMWLKVGITSPWSREKRKWLIWKEYTYNHVYSYISGFSAGYQH